MLWKIIFLFFPWAFSNASCWFLFGVSIDYFSHMVQMYNTQNIFLFNTLILLFRQEIRTATSSMTSVPKPLKFLRPHYGTLKEYFGKMSESVLRVFLNFYFFIKLPENRGSSVGSSHSALLRYLLLNKIILSLFCRNIWQIYFQSWLWPCLQKGNGYEKRLYLWFFSFS